MSRNPDETRVLVTGIGIAHRLGMGVDPFWEALLAGRSGIARINRFDIDEYTCKVASFMDDFVPEAYMDPKEVKRTDRFVHFAMAGAKLAVEDAGLDVRTLDPWRFGVLLGSGIGGLQTVQEQTLRLNERGPRKVSPFMLPALIANISGGNVAIAYNARGPNYCTVSACASSTHAIGEAMHLLKRGDADIVITGGSEASIVEVGQAGFCSMRAMSTGFNDEPERASRPFDARRDGFVMGEGAGVLILETEEHARKRGAAKVYAEVFGYGCTCDAYHITGIDPTGEGLAKAIERALQCGGVGPEAIDYVNAHGTSTLYNDKCETLSLKNALGARAREIPVGSTKSMTGHLLGAAGALEAATCAKVLSTGLIPPTINYEYPDPDCDLDYVPNQAREGKVQVAMTNNLGFGGHNVSLILRQAS